MKKITKQEIRDRLRHNQRWVTQTRTPLFIRAGGTDADVPEAKIRYVVAIFVCGNRLQTQDLTVEKLLEDATYQVVVGPIPVAAADFRALPQSYDIEQEFVRCEGGTRLYARTDGHSLSVTTEWWDNQTH